MSEPKTDYVPDVRRYVPSVDEAAVAGIVKDLWHRTTQQGFFVGRRE